MLSALVAIAASVLSAAAQDAAKDAKTDPSGEQKTKGTNSRRLDDFARDAAEYAFVLNGKTETKAVLAAEPVLRWTNPLRKTDDGGVFLWTANGRPEVIASFYQYRNQDVLVVDHEFQSLATTGLTANRAGKPFWSPEVAGIALRPIPGAPSPAATASIRARQMNALAREFRAFIDYQDKNFELRLLTKPLYRYEASRPDLTDGALFAFVQTTDPEVLLLIEARPANRVPTWHYAVARMSVVGLRADHKGQEVWRVDVPNNSEDPAQPYFTLHDAERRR